MLSVAQRRRALQAADDLQNQLGLAQDSPIDIFDVVDELGLWLVFNRLDNLLGAVVPRGEGGIMISTQRGAAVQRYTAAHEIGHWIMDYGEAAFDTEGDIYFPTADRELLAQLFAGQLLMPAPLLYEMCGRYGIQNAESATPTSVYQAARDMGTSFEATVRQLDSLGIVDSSTRDRLLRIRPSVIKSQLALGHRPSGAVDVWAATFSPGSETVRVTEGDEIVVALPENRTTGHRWLTAAEMEERRRRRSSAPPANVGEQILEQDGNWRPRNARRSASAIRRAVHQLPGGQDPKRTLSTVSSEAPHELDFEPRSDWAESAMTPRPASVDKLEDRYRASWTDAAPSAMRTVRRAIAGLNTSGGLSSDIGTFAISGTGTRVVALKSGGEGQQTVNLFYTSAYEPDAPIVEEYVLSLEVAVQPSVLRRRLILGSGDEGSPSDLEGQ